MLPFSNEVQQECGAISWALCFAKPKDQAEELLLFVIEAGFEESNSDVIHTARLLLHPLRVAKVYQTYLMSAYILGMIACYNAI